MSWRLARSLVTLRDQVNGLYPGRSTASDGTIGDAAHQAEGSASDHNPWLIDASGTGVVTAIDLTHDPADGFAIAEFGGDLVAQKDGRIKYIIQNALICLPAEGWYWQVYNGTDPHTNHIHISVSTSPSLYDDAQQWSLSKETNMALRDTVIADAVDEHLVFIHGLKRAPYQQEKGRYVGKTFGFAVDDMGKNQDNSAGADGKGGIDQMAQAYYKNGSKIPFNGDPAEHALVEAIKAVI